MRIPQRRLYLKFAALRLGKALNLALRLGQHIRRIQLHFKGVIVCAVLGDRETICLAQRTGARMAQQRGENPGQRRADRTHRILRQFVEACQLAPTL